MLSLLPRATHYAPRSTYPLTAPYSPLPTPYSLLPTPEASVVFLFLLPGLNARLRPRLAAQLRPGARVLSAHFQARTAHSRTLALCTLAHVLYTLACALYRVRSARAYTVTLCIRRGPHIRSHMHSMHLSQCMCTHYAVQA